MYSELETLYSIKIIIPFNLLKFSKFLLGFKTR